VCDFEVCAVDIPYKLGFIPFCEVYMEITYKYELYVRSIEDQRKLRRCIQAVGVVLVLHKCGRFHEPEP
jgi:hypothetical protein